MIRFRLRGIKPQPTVDDVEYHAEVRIVIVDTHIYRVAFGRNFSEPKDGWRKNLWGVSIESGRLEDPWFEPKEDMFILTTSPEEAKDYPEYVEVHFEDGIPKDRGMGLECTPR